MNITIIGVSETFARSLADWAIEAGHNVTFVGPTYPQALALVEELGTGKPMGPEGQIEDDVIFIATPYICLQPVLQTYTKVIGKRIVVDLITPFNLGNTQFIHSADGSAAHEILRSWTESIVLKAFSPRFAVRFAPRRNNDNEPSELLLAGDDNAAKQQISQLFGQTGIRVIDAGPLQQAKQLENLGYKEFQKSLKHKIYQI